MKCKNCGTEMDMWQHAVHMHFIDNRWRCPLCAYEDAEVIARKPPEYKEPKTDTKK